MPLSQPEAEVEIVEIDRLAPTDGVVCLPPHGHVGSDQPRIGAEFLRQSCVGTTEHPVEVGWEPARPFGLVSGKWRTPDRHRARIVERGEQYSSHDGSAAASSSRNTRISPRANSAPGVAVPPRTKSTLRSVCLFVGCDDLALLEAVGNHHEGKPASGLQLLPNAPRTDAEFGIVVDAEDQLQRGGGVCLHRAHRQNHRFHRPRLNVGMITVAVAGGGMSEAPETRRSDCPVPGSGNSNMDCPTGLTAATSERIFDLYPDLTLGNVGNRCGEVSGRQIEPPGRAWVVLPPAPAGTGPRARRQTVRVTPAIDGEFSPHPGRPLPAWSCWRTLPIRSPRTAMPGSGRPPAWERLNTLALVSVAHGVPSMVYTILPGLHSTPTVCHWVRFTANVSLIWRGSVPCPVLSGRVERARAAPLSS